MAYKDYEYSANRDGEFVTVPPIDKLCLILKDKFLRQEENNEYLREENKKLKEGILEKEEIARLKKDYETMREDCYRGFPISEDEKKAIDEWKTKYKDRHYGAIGGGFTYKFTPTSLGTIGVIVGPDGDEFKFQDIM